MHDRWRDRSAIAALAVAAFALRLAFRIDYDEDIDALRFALAVDDFDVAALRPHAPFYPVYIALAKCLALLVRSPVRALGVLSALSGALVVTHCALLAGALAGRRAAWSAGALALASPFLWLSSEKCSSDITGAAFVSGGLLLAALARGDGVSAEKARGMRTAALVVLGLGLGVRLSYFPFAIGCLVAIVTDEPKGRARVGALLGHLRDLLFGVVAWLVPLVVVAGAPPLVAQTRVQMIGHFTRWGGTVMTVSSPADRLYGLAWGLWANVLGGAWPDAAPVRWLGAPVIVVLLVLAVRSVGSWRDLFRRQPEIALASVLYLAWAALGQNIAFKPRHLLPLTPLVIVALARGVEALASRLTRAGVRAAMPILGALVLQWMFDAERLAQAHLEPSPAAAIVAFLRGEEAAGSEPRLVLTRELERMIATGAPGRRVLTAPDDDAVLRALDVEGAAGVLVTSEALSRGVIDTLRARGASLRVVFARPRSRYVDSLWSDLALFEIAPPSVPR